MKDAEAVKRYRDRKLSRLKARFDADDVDWITTESGSHIPIKDGVAIGGPLKGQKFLRATTEKPDGTRKRTSTRRRRKTASTRKTSAGKTSTDRSKSAKETAKTGAPKLTATHQKFKDRLKDYQAKREQAKKDAVRYKEDADYWHGAIVRLERGFPDTSSGFMDAGDYKEILEHKNETAQRTISDLQWVKKYLDDPPKKGDKLYPKYHGELKLLGIASKNAKEKKEFVENKLVSARASIKENRAAIEALDDYIKTGKYDKKNALVEEYKKKEAQSLEKTAKAESDDAKFRDARRNLVNKTLKTWDDCKDSVDIKERVLNSGMFKAPETMKDLVFGKFDIPNPNSGTSIERCDFESLKSAMKHLDSFFERYPKLMGQFYPIDAYFPSKEKEYRTKTDEAYAYTEPGLGKVHLNREFLEDPAKVEESEKKMKAKGHRAVYGGYKSILFHEYGHAIDGLLTKTLRKNEQIKDHELFSDKVVEKCVEKFKMNELELHKSLCNYGIGDRSEFLAEAFAEYTCSEKPRKVAQYVGKLVEDEMRKQGYL